MQLVYSFYENNCSAKIETQLCCKKLGPNFRKKFSPDFMSNGFVHMPCTGIIDDELFDVQVVLLTFLNNNRTYGLLQ